MPSNPLALSDSTHQPSPQPDSAPLATLERESAHHWDGWHLRALVARSHAPSDDVAVRRARVSVPIIRRECADNPAFARDWAKAVSRSLVLDAKATSRVAREEFVALVGDAADMARGLDPATGERWTEAVYSKDGEVIGHRDVVRPLARNALMRTVGEAAEQLGQGAQVQGAGVQITAAQVYILVQQQLAQGQPPAAAPPTVEATATVLP